MDAEKLAAGDRLTSPDGATHIVVSIRARTVITKVYNLTASGVHTYYVLAHATPVLVHNCGTTDLYLTAQKGNGVAERARGLDPANHPIDLDAGNDGSAWFGGNRRTVETFADPAMTSHENFITKFAVDNSFFEIARRHPGFYEDIYELDGSLIHEIGIPHGLIDLFNRKTVAKTPG